MRASYWGSLFFYKSVYLFCMMFAAIPVELITMVAGGVTGFIFRFMAERAKEKAETFRMALNLKKAEDESADKALKRVPLEGGKIVRRFIVVTVLFGVVLAPFILAFTGHSTIVQVTEEEAKYFFGLFGGGTSIKFVELQGYLMVPETRQTLTAIVGFYFGNASARTR